MKAHQAAAQTRRGAAAFEAVERLELDYERRIDMKHFTDALKKVWARLTGSKVAWMSLPAGIAQIWLAISGNDISPALEAVFSGLWLILGVFLAVNDPTSRERF